MVPNQYIKQGEIIELQRHTTLTSTEVELIDSKQCRTETEFRPVLHSPEEATSDDGNGIQRINNTGRLSCIKNITHHERTEPNQTRYARESDKFKNKPNSPNRRTRGQHNYTIHAAKAAHRDQSLNAK